MTLNNLQYGMYIEVANWRLELATVTLHEWPSQLILHLLKAR